MKRTRLVLTAAVCATALLAVGCSSNGGTSGGETKEENSADVQIELLPKNDEIAAMVPEDIRDRGKLIIATDATAPPNQFFDEDGKTLIGNEVDFGDQIASILGLEIEWVNVSFDSIIPGLEAGRYDTALTGMRVTKERQETVDFVSYAQAGPQLFGPADNPDGITDVNDLCGFTISMQSGTTQLAVVEEVSKTCVADGKEPIEILTFKTQNEQIQAVSSGRAPYGAQNAPNNTYLAEQTDGALVGIGEVFASGPWGMPVPKNSGLLEPLHLATQELVESKQYDQILEKWGVEIQGIDSSEINNAIN